MTHPGDEDLARSVHQAATTLNAAVAAAVSAGLRVDLRVDCKIVLGLGEIVAVRPDVLRRIDERLRDAPDRGTLAASEEARPGIDPAARFAVQEPPR